MQIQIPVQLQKAMRELPPIPPFNESLPTPPKPLNLIRDAIVITGLMILVGYIYIKLQPLPQPMVNDLLSLLVMLFLPLINFLILGFKILLLAGLFLILGPIYKIYQSRLRDHSVLTESYFELLESYSHRQSEYEQKIFLSQTSDRLREFRSPRILKILRSTNTEIIQKIPVGDIPESELVITDKIKNEPFIFSKSLKKSLKDNLHYGITVQTPEFNYIFRPDFTYINLDTNLHLAIAISEQLGKNSDKNIKEQQNICHTFLLKSGWIVANLNPNEVLDQPDQCAQAITNLIQELSCEPEPLL